MGLLKTPRLSLKSDKFTYSYPENVVTLTSPCSAKLETGSATFAKVILLRKSIWLPLRPYLRCYHFLPLHSKWIIVEKREFQISTDDQLPRSGGKLKTKLVKTVSMIGYIDQSRGFSNKTKKISSNFLSFAAIFPDTSVTGLFRKRRTIIERKTNSFQSYDVIHIDVLWRGSWMS